MSLLNAIAQRPTLNPSVHGAVSHNAAASAARQSLAGARAAQLAAPDVVKAGDNNVTLSRKALDARIEQLGEQVMSTAQSFLQQFATALFGDAAKGDSFDFDSVSVSAEASLSSAAVQASQQGDGGSASVQAAALRFDESASFIGHGTLHTGDGQSYEFDIAVDYQASVSASSAAASTTSTTRGNGSARAAESQESAPTPEQALVGKQLPPVKYPGSLADLFKLLGRQLDVDTRNGDPDGQLSLRLIRLVNSAALLAPRARSESADSEAGAAANPLSAAQRGRALAQYAAPESTATQPAPAAGDASPLPATASDSAAAFSASA